MSSAEYGAVGVQNRTRTLFGQVMWSVAATAGLFALGAYLGRNLSSGVGFIGFIAAFCLPDRHAVRGAQVRVADDRARTSPATTHRNSCPRCSPPCEPAPRP